MQAKQGPAHRRKRNVSASVRIGEQLARALITLGGIGTVIAVTLIFVFLVWVVVPLFLGASIESQQEVSAGLETEPVRLLVDQHRLLITDISDDGSFVVMRHEDGTIVQEGVIFGDKTPTATRVYPSGGRAAFGFADGTVAVGTIEYGVEYLPENTPGFEDLEAGEARIYDEGVVTLTPIGQLRLSRLIVSMGEPQAIGNNSAVRLVDYVEAGSAQAFAALTQDGRLAIYKIRERKNLLTGKVTVTLTERALPYEHSTVRGYPDHLLVTAGGDNLILLWEDGRLERYDARGGNEPSLAEATDVIEEDDLVVTSAELMIGGSTLVVGDSSGKIRSWFRIKPEGTATVDGSYLVPAHEIEGFGAAVTSLAPSPRSRMIAAGYGNGDVRLYYVTAASTLAEIEAPAEGAIDALTMTPREDGLVAMLGGRLVSWTIDPKHPEVTTKALFGPVWYEGYNSPEHVWQSSSGTDAFEPKLGLVPLVYGTIKATVYSMLFGVPLALLAAIYTSEFMHRRWRNPIKSSIEMMASLPSVVLGFLAASVFAPFVESIVPAVLASFITIPGTFLMGAYLWQLLPRSLSRRWAGKQKVLAMTMTIPTGIGMATVVGPLLESLLFGGDIKAWLDGQSGNGIGGWVLLLLPIAGFAAFMILGRLFGPLTRSMTREWDDRACALFDLGRFVVGAALAVLLAALFGSGLSSAGFDPRGSLLGTYGQRNALIVGFVMGFAVIPIIYTIAEDALSSVPEHLRLGSLGAGATPWQTAVRIVIPTAMSGLFSAVMVGLGRAVGETMVVLMATGNTAVMEINPFSGFRTLSANIAVELPEAVQNSTHYRTLFLAALTLFAMTFALNTIAESVRQRFRKRAFEL